MSRASDWLESTLFEDFPDDAEFAEGSNANHVIVRWTITDAAGRERRNAPFVIIIDQAIIDVWDGSNEHRQSEIESRVQQIFATRRAHYDESGPVAVPRAFEVHLDEGDL
jgi:hypothetical protein